MFTPYPDFSGLDLRAPCFLLFHVLVTVWNTESSSCLFSACLPCPHTMHAYVSVSVSFYFLIYFWGAFVSPCWQRGITGPGIENSSQAFGWRSTLQTKRMLVHLKVATEVPADVFAVTLNNSALFGFNFQYFLQEVCLWLLYGLVCCVFMWVLCSSVFPFHCQSHSI